MEPTGGKIPSDYAPWAGQHQLDSNQFWLYIVAAAHHRGYWTEGHPYAQQLLDQQTMPPLSDDPDTIKRLIDLGQQLLEAWSVDKMTPVKHSQDSAGVWTFDGEDAAEAIVLHGRDVLAKWRDSRSIADKTGWSKTAAEQYARVIAALLATDRIADEVADLLGEPEQPEGG